MKIMPIFFGSRNDETHIKNLFQEGILSKLPTIQPTACLKVAKNLLSQVGITMSSQMSRSTVKEMVTEVTKYLFLCGWESKNAHQLTRLAANKIVSNLNECLGVNPEDQSSIQKNDPGDSKVGSMVVSSLLSSSVSSAVVDYEAAWAVLQNPSRSTNFSALSELLECNGVVSADDLEFLFKDPELFERVVSLLKNISQMKFRAMFTA
jgi:hypothetical protein